MTEKKSEKAEKQLDLTIKDLTVHDPVISIHKNIPSIPFNMSVFGKSSSGKTNMILNLLNWYSKIFKNRTFIFTASRNGSLYSLESSLKAKIFNELYNDKGESIIDKIIEFQRERKEKGKKLEHLLILFDDFITDQSFQKKNSIYTKLYSMARHFNISVITTAQQITQMPSTIRRLSWYDCVFKISNNAEKKLYITENCNAIDKSESQFEEIYNSAVKESFSFLYINKKDGTYSTRFGK